MPSLAQKYRVILATLTGQARRAFKQTITTAKGRASVGKLMSAIESGDMGAAMHAAGYRDGMWTQLAEVIRNGYNEGGVFSMDTTVPKRFGSVFNLANPRAAEWLRKSSSSLVTNITAETERSIQTMLQRGMRLGANPRTTALDIVGRISPQTGRRTGGVIGLTNQQTRWVDNMYDDLFDMDERYFTRRLRDKRFDKIVRESIASSTRLPIEVRKKILDGYSDRMLRHRGETIARTETLKAINEANDEAMRQVVDQGLAGPNDIKKIWRHSFAKEARPGHLQLSGQERLLDEYFVNPVTSAVLRYPGDGEASEIVNCRCYIENKVDFGAVEGGKQATGGAVPAKPVIPPVTPPPTPVSMAVPRFKAPTPQAEAQLIGNARSFYDRVEDADVYSDKLLAALKSYQGDDYKGINSVLRGTLHLRNAPPRALRAKQILTKAFREGGEAMTLEQDSLFYRGLGSEGSRIVKKLKVGDTYTDNGLFSTSISDEVAKAFARRGAYGEGNQLPVLLKIQVDGGTQVVPMVGGGINTYELEVLLGPGTKFQVTAIDVTDKFTVYHLRTF